MDSFCSFLKKSKTGISEKKTSYNFESVQSVMHEQKIAICPPKELLVLMLPSPISKAILNALEIEAKTIIYTAMYFIPFAVTCPTFDD